MLHDAKSSCSYCRWDFESVCHRDRGNRRGWAPGGRLLKDVTCAASPTRLPLVSPLRYQQSLRRYWHLATTFEEPPLPVCEITSNSLVSLGRSKFGKPSHLTSHNSCSQNSQWRPRLLHASTLDISIRSQTRPSASWGKSQLYGEIRPLSMQMGVSMFN